MPDTSRVTSKQSQADLLTSVMNSCRDSIIACNSESQIIAWNRGAVQIYGFRSHEVMDKDIRLIVPPERHGEIDCMAEAALKGKPIEHFDTVRIRKSGQAFPASVCSFPIRGKDGAIDGFAVIERDVSERVEAADAVQEALSEAERANSAKSQFLANVSHELRTPMNAIVGMTALALEEELSPELEDYLETIRDSAAVLLQLVNDVLDLSKFESNQFELDEVVFSPRELVEGTIKVLASAAHAKGIELVSQVAPETPSELVGDPVRLRQVLTNLVGNAVKFTSTGEVVVVVDAKKVDKADCQLTIGVRDTGIGISNEDISKIFAPFTQVDSATTRKYSGTGLGLTISQHLLAKFGSQLHVESEPNKGSCFSFSVELPIAKGSSTASNDLAIDKLRGLTTLIIDDNEASRESLVELLSEWDMHPQTASSGIEGLKLLQAADEAGESFKLVLVDALMPGMDGFEVVSQIESDSRIDAKPILLASTADRLEFSRRCAEAGAAAYVEKPISQSQLFSAVAQATGVATIDSEKRGGLFDRPKAPMALKVLLVEDTPANRKVVQRVLAKRGHHVEVAVNGREAVAEFKNGSFDVILMDVQMPIMDGLQATAAIRELERDTDTTSPVPIVAMTAHSMRGDRRRCLKAGMDHYLSKPIDLEKLITTVESSSTLSNANATGLATKPKQTLSAAEGPSPAAKSDHWDEEAALARLRGDRQLLREMIEFFLEDYTPLLETLESSQDDLALIERTAHSLKGLAATFEAKEAVSAASDVEKAARSGNDSELESKIAHAVTSTKELASELKLQLKHNPESELA